MPKAYSDLVKQAASAVASVKDPELRRAAFEKILASHALIHTADGELFREALLHASNRCGLRDFRIKEKELLDRAGQVLRLKGNALMRRVTELGRPLGSPWSQDEKFATIAAWLALAAPAKNNSKEHEKSAAS